MRSKSALWFVCKVRYDKEQGDGLMKKVSEAYVIDAVSFGDAEKRIIEEMAQYISAEFEVEDITKAPFKEIFFDDREEADRWYKAKLEFITIDERTEKEKRSSVVYLVKAGTLNEAVRNIDEVMRGTMTDYDSVAVQETKIVTVFEYTKGE